MELSGTGVPPSLLGEVQERRSGASRGAGAAYRLVPAEIKHCVDDTLEKSNFKFCWKDLVRCDD